MADKRVDIIRIQKIKESSILYKNRIINSPSTAADFFRHHLEEKDREYFMVAYMATNNEPVAIETISIGTLNTAIIHPREVFKGAVLSNCASILLAHNHPSGNTKPSEEDKALTKRLEEAGAILGISILDHIIIGNDGQFYSFKEEGLLDSSN